MKTDYDSSGIKTDYFLIRARIELIKTDYNRLKLHFNWF